LAAAVASVATCAPPRCCSATGHDVLIDAGTGVGDLSLEMREIRECAGIYQPRRLENNQVFEL